MDLWNPEQYGKFRDERARPFWDLAKRVNFEKVDSMLDIGCGTGELTHALHLAHQLRDTLGIDSSPNMLSQAQDLSARGLKFELAAIESYRPVDNYDLVFSNAALQWVPGHESLFAHLVRLIRPGGQLAVQMPINHDHISHTAAEVVAEEFGMKPRPIPVLKPETYAKLLWNLGMHGIDISTQVYLHPMPSARDVVEWTRGTLLNYYLQRLGDARFDEFLKAYTREVLKNTGAGMYLFTFKRLFIYAKKE